MEGIRAVLARSMGRSLSGLTPADRLAAAWVIVCGRMLAGRGTVVGYDDGLVRIEVRDREWLEQMRSMGGHLQAELARIAGVRVSKLHFEVKD
jgi:Dna[CI] antecedent, DciA